MGAAFWCLVPDAAPRSGDLPRRSTGLSDRDRHFPKVRAARHIGKGLAGLIERKGLVDHRLHSIDGDRIDHGLEILDRSDRDALQALLLHHHQRQPKFGRRRSGKHPDKGDGTADPDGPDRLVEGADPADLHDKIDAVPAPFTGLLPQSGVFR